MIFKIMLTKIINTSSFKWFTKQKNSIYKYTVLYYVLIKMFFFSIYSLNIFYKINLIHLNIILDYFQHQRQLCNLIFLSIKLDF